MIQLRSSCQARTGAHTQIEFFSELEFEISSAEWETTNGKVPKNPPSPSLENGYYE